MIKWWYLNIQFSIEVIEIMLVGFWVFLFACFILIKWGKMTAGPASKAAAFLPQGL